MTRRSFTVRQARLHPKTIKILNGLFGDVNVDENVDRRLLHYFSSDGFKEDLPVKRFLEGHAGAHHFCDL